MKKKLLSAILALGMVFAMSPIGLAYATESGTQAETEVSVQNASGPDSGTCGENLTWKLDSEGTLTISGSGEMDNYDYDYDSKAADSPWKENRLSIQKVVIETGVTGIGDHAFSGCSNLTSIIIPDSVTSIGSAFVGCSSLTSINIPDGVTSIDSGTFQNCGSLTSINIPDGVTSIGSGAFDGCSSLTSIIIPDSVTSISMGAFWGCSSLINITLPKGNARIGDTAFYDTGYYETESNWEDGCLYCCAYLLHTRDDLTGECRVKEGTKVITYDAFRRTKGLTKIIIPESVTYIDEYAFNGCPNLTEISAPFGSVAEAYAKEHGIPFNGYEAKKEEPSENKPTDISKELQDKIANTEKGAAVSAEIPANAIVSKEVIKAAKDKGVKLEIKSLSGTPTVWTFTEMTNEMDFNPAVTAGVSSKPIEKKLAGAALSDTFQYTQVRFAHEGVLPGKAVAALDLSSIDKFTDGETVYLYYYNPDKALFEKVGSAVYTKGTAAFTMTHCSDYIVTNQELPAVLTYANTSQAPASPGTGDVDAVIYYMLLLFGMAVIVTAGIRKKEW